MEFTKRAGVGLVLMVLGTLALLPGVAPTGATVPVAALGVAAVVLAFGTYLVGTDVSGRAV